MGDYMRQDQRTTLTETNKTAQDTWTKDNFSCVPVDERTLFLGTGSLTTAALCLRVLFGSVALRKEQSKHTASNGRDETRVATQMGFVVQLIAYESGEASVY
jgi:hypothetical protein